jgi:hypothetical protein
MVSFIILLRSCTYNLCWTLVSRCRADPAASECANHTIFRRPDWLAGGPWRLLAASANHIGRRGSPANHRRPPHTGPSKPGLVRALHHRIVPNKTSESTLDYATSPWGLPESARWLRPPALPRFLSSWSLSQPWGLFSLAFIWYV